MKPSPFGLSKSRVTYEPAALRFKLRYTSPFCRRLVPLTEGVVTSLSGLALILLIFWTCGVERLSKPFALYGESADHSPIDGIAFAPPENWAPQWLIRSPSCGKLLYERSHRYHLCPLPCVWRLSWAGSTGTNPKEINATRCYQINDQKPSRPFFFPSQVL